MKELFTSILTLIGAIFVSIFILSLGSIYSLGYSIWLSITLKKWNAFFIFWWRLLDGLLFAIANIIHSIAYSLDLIWNVNGEMIEDIITAEEKTTFNNRAITVSASVGKLQKEGKLNNTGKWFSKSLNIVFGQKSHAIDAWEYLKAKNKLDKKYFQK